MIIGITGGSGSGKTTFASALINRLSPARCCVISQDAYYRDNSHIPIEDRQKINFDHPNAFDFDLLLRHILDLKAGRLIHRPCYSFLSCARINDTVLIDAAPFILLEGIFVLYDERLRNQLDLKIFLNATRKKRLKRIYERDIKERGRTAEEVVNRFYQVVDPMHELFVEPVKNHADLIFLHNDTNLAVEKSIEYIYAP